MNRIRFGLGFLELGMDHLIIGDPHGQIFLLEGEKGPFGGGI